eukprot:4918899-Pyramimonas_sp.AAC.1
MPFGLGVVSQSVMRDVVHEECFSRLVINADASHLLLGDVAWADGEKKGDEAMCNLPFNKAVSEWCSFIDAGCVGGVLIPGTSLNGDSIHMPAKHAKLYLDMVAQVREVAGTVAQLHTNISASTARMDDVIFGTFVHAQSMAARALPRLDNHL